MIASMMMMCCVIKTPEPEAEVRVSYYWKVLDLLCLEDRRSPTHEQDPKSQGPPIGQTNFVACC